MNVFKKSDLAGLLVAHFAPLSKRQRANLASTNLHASLQGQGASFLQLFLVGKSGVVGGSQGVVTS